MQKVRLRYSSTVRGNAPHISDAGWTGPIADITDGSPAASRLLNRWVLLKTKPGFDLRQRQADVTAISYRGRDEKEIVMSSSNRSGRTTAAKFDKMMERLGIDPGYILAPRLGLAFSCALRTCRSCTACEECAECWQETPRPFSVRPSSVRTPISFGSFSATPPSVAARISFP